jgi:GT2 family glycosyltransferase
MTGIPGWAGRIGVVVVNYNGGDLVLRCLETLSRQTLAPARVVVVDNGSTDGSAEAIRHQYPNVELISAGRNLGFAAGNNLGVRSLVDCDWIALLNPDAFPDPRWLEALARAAVTRPEFQLFGSRMLMADDPSLLDGVGDAYHVSGLHWRMGHGLPAKDAYQTQMEIFAPCAAAAMYRRDVWLEANGFDEDYFCYAEDVDLGFRLRLLGYRALYVPEAVVKHKGSATTGRRSDFAVFHGGRNLIWTFVKNFPGAWFWLFLPMHVVGNLAIACVHGPASFKGRLEALVRLPGVWRKRRAIQSRRTVSYGELRRVLSRGLLDPIRAKTARKRPAN